MVTIHNLSVAVLITVVLILTRYSITCFVIAIVGAVLWSFLAGDTTIEKSEEKKEYRIPPPGIGSHGEFPKKDLWMQDFPLAVEEGPESYPSLPSRELEEGPERYLGVMSREIRINKYGLEEVD